MSHQSGPPDGVSHGASAGSEPPLHKSGSRGLPDRSPLRRIPACPYDSDGNSSVSQLQRGQRWEVRRSRKKKKQVLGQSVMNPKMIYSSLHKCTTSLP